MRLILLNAPPYAGKDTAAAAIIAAHAQHRLLVLDRMSMPIKRAFAGTMGLRCSPTGFVEPYERRKEMPIPQLGGVSYRQWQIDFSEKFMKPLYGNAVFGELLWDRLLVFENDTNAIVIVPDCGFQIEVDVLLKHMPADRIMLIRLARPGCMWDSRQQVFMPEPTLTIDINNNKTAADLEATVLAATEKWINR